VLYRGVEEMVVRSFMRMLERDGASLDMAHGNEENARVGWRRRLKRDALSGDTSSRIGSRVSPPDVV
jgi:hypothetical protein